MYSFPSGLQHSLRIGLHCGYKLIPTSDVARPVEPAAGNGGRWHHQRMCSRSSRSGKIVIYKITTTQRHGTLRAHIEGVWLLSLSPGCVSCGAPSGGCQTWNLNDLQQTYPKQFFANKKKPPTASAAVGIETHVRWHVIAMMPFQAVLCCYYVVMFKQNHLEPWRTLPVESKQCKRVRVTT